MDLTNQNKQRKKRISPSVDLMVYGKVPPQSKEIEEAVLGGILIDSNCLIDVISLINEEMFYVDAHQRIFKAILSIYDKSNRVDTLTVMEQLKSTEELDIVGGSFALTKLTNNVVSTAHIDFHCKILTEKYMAREMIKIAGEALNDAYEDSTDVFDLYDRTDSQVFKIQEGVLKGALKDMSFYSAQVYEQYETVKHTGVLGIQTGIIPFDKIFCGLVAPDLLIIAARPGAGKTSLALSLTHHISIINGKAGAWFSLEMDGTQLTRRLASIDSGISHEAIRQGKIDNENSDKFFRSLDKISKAPIFIEDKSVINIRTIRTRAHVLIRKHKIEYIIVDYLQLMNGLEKKNGNREGEISEISRGLKALAKELSIPIIALSQLSRKVEERADKMPQLSDLRESGAIEQDADGVLFLMRPEYYGFTESVSIGDKVYDVSGLCICKGAKNRHGACMNFAMGFNGPTMHFSTHRNDVDFPYQSSDEMTF